MSIGWDAMTHAKNIHGPRRMNGDFSSSTIGRSKDQSCWTCSAGLLLVNEHYSQALDRFTQSSLASHNLSVFDSLDWVPIGAGLEIFVKCQKSSNLKSTCA